MPAISSVSNPIDILQAIKQQGWRESTSLLNVEIPSYLQFRKDAPEDESPFLWYSLEVLNNENLKVKISDEYYRKSVGQSTRVSVTAEVGTLENLKKFCQWIAV
jgi:hypothetical protein